MIDINSSINNLPNTFAPIVPCKLMLVDDDMFLLGIYSHKFINNKFEVESFHDAAAALEKLKSGYVPEVLLLDILMPNMTGLDLLQKIRDEKLVPHSTIIMLTNESDPTEITRAKELGIQGYIVKATTIPSEVVQTTSDIHREHMQKK
jgi:CheY-like chemotaxis protein